MADQNKIGDMFKESVESLRSIVDANTIIGNPVTANGTTIIPISKVSVGYAGAGNDYAGKNTKDDKYNFAGAGGTGVSVVPVAFIVIKEDGTTEILNMNNPTGENDGVSNAVSLIQGKIPPIVEKIKEYIKNKKKNKKNGKESDDSSTEVAETEEEDK